MEFSTWIEQRAKSGGINYTSDKDLGKAKHADLITLPVEVKGTNCSNCKFVSKTDDGAFCEHKEVQLSVTPRMCCKYWDHDKVERSWGEMDA